MTFSSVLLPILVTLAFCWIGFPHPTQFEVVYSDIPVDLSYHFDDKTVYWPTVSAANLSFNIRSISDGRLSNGLFYRAKYFKTAEHGGTHVDAPSHFWESGIDVSQIPLENLTGPLVVLNVSQKVIGNVDYQVTLDDVADWEARCGPLPIGGFVVMFSNWGVRWPNLTRVFESSTPFDTTTLHFPGFRAETVEHLISRYQIKGVGVDTPSTDFGQSTDFSVHVTLARNGLIGLENVANLNKMTSCHAKVMGFPMKISGGSGAPIRLSAWSGRFEPLKRGERKPSSE